MSDNTPNIAGPVGKVEIAVAPIGAYIPNDPSQDYHAAHFAPAVSSAEMKFLEYNKNMKKISNGFLNLP